MEYTAKNENETFMLGKQLGESLKSGAVLAIYGDLGSGKTHFISGVAAGLGYNGETYSPTFAIVNEYFGGRIPMYHFDMYRISGWEDLYSTGFFEAVDSNAVVAVEWSENIEGALPDGTVRIRINGSGDMPRKIALEGIEF